VYGAGAVVPSNRGGFARQRSTASSSDSSLEPIHRGVTGCTDGPFLDGKPVDPRSRKTDYLLQEKGAHDRVMQQTTRHASQVLQEPLDDADAKLSDACWSGGESESLPAYRRRPGVPRRAPVVTVTASTAAAARR
jgi:3-oxoacyl-[acyl-carrier-protein] synthase-3